MSYWNLPSPGFHSNNLELGRQLISFPQWSSKGMHTLPAFQDIHKHFNLLHTSVFSISNSAQRCTLMMCPRTWPFSTQTFQTALTSPSGLVSTAHYIWHEASCETLSVDRLWKAGLSPKSSSPFWKLIWQKMQLSSRELSHQAIHFNYIHRTCVTLRTLYKMKAGPSPNCILCTQNMLGTCFHLGWECPEVAEMISKILSKTIPYLPEVLWPNSSNLGVVWTYRA